MSLGVVSAVSAIDITSPVNGESYDEKIDIEWTVTGFFSGPVTYGIFYMQSDDCDDTQEWATNPSVGIIAQGRLYNPQPLVWDISSLPDGDDYCLRVTGSDGINFGNDQVGQFTIDHTDPLINNFVVNYDGKERDRPPIDNTEKAEVYLHATDDNMDFCEINWDDGTTTDCSGDTTKSYRHQYEDDGNYEVVVTVRDVAENEATADVTISPENVAPTIDSEIGGSTDVASGQAVMFDATADDVEADLDAGLICEWTFDGSDEVETTADSDGKCEVSYTWASASIHTVDLCVKDKDGGENCDFIQYEVDVQDPEHMTPMQQVVADSVFEFELDSPWAVSNPYRFKTSFSNLVICDEVVVPNGMTVAQGGPDNRCQVTWTPTNDERGEHPVIIRVEDDVTGDYKYYSFDVTVYSWGIALVPGWNLISIPYMPENTKINSVFGGIIENVAYEGTSTYTIYQYNAVEDQWYRARKYSSNSGYTGTDKKLSNIVPGYGYWIKMDAEDTIYGAEDMFPINTVPGATGINLATESWNLIGRFGSDPASLFWKTALRTLRKPFYNKHYVSALLGIYGLDSVTASGETTWSVATDIELAEGYWVRTAEGENGRTTVRYEPDSI